MARAIERLAQLKARLSHPVANEVLSAPEQHLSTPWKPRDRPYDSSPPVKVSNSRLISISLTRVLAYHSWCGHRWGCCFDIDI